MTRRDESEVGSPVNCYTRDSGGPVHRRDSHANHSPACVSEAYRRPQIVVTNPADNGDEEEAGYRSEE
jgi:hypothetical protein